jgi:hypothetical protein
MTTGDNSGYLSQLNNTQEINKAKKNSTSVTFYDVNREEIITQHVSGARESNTKTRTNQPPSVLNMSNSSSASSTQPTSGYVIFGGSVQIFNDNWKTREPFSGKWEANLFDCCWEKGDCLLASIFPCIYDCLLTTAISNL